MKKRLLSALAMCLSVFAMAFAEDVNYNGVVVAENGTPIMGATVSVTGTELSTMTDMDGKFSITIPNGYSAITISYAGMKRQTINVQRDPVILYPTAEDAYMAQERKMPKLKNVYRDYKKDLFNLEINYGSIYGDLADCFSNEYSYSDKYLGLNFGWHHNYKEWIGWEVFNINGMLPVGNGSDSENIVLSITTGLKLTTPSWKNMSLFTSFNIGAGASIESWDETISVVLRGKVGVNLGKWVYVAYGYDYLNDFNYESYTRSDYYGYQSFNRHSVAIGFNF